MFYTGPIAMKIGLIVMCFGFYFLYSQIFFRTENICVVFGSIERQAIESRFFCFLVSRFCVLKKSLAKNTGKGIEIEK